MDKERPQALYDLLKMSSLGLEMGVAVIVGLLFGSWLDGQFDTRPWLTMLFLAFGFAAAIKAVVRALRKGVFEDDQEDWPEVGPENGPEEDQDNAPAG